MKRPSTTLHLPAALLLALLLSACGGEKPEAMLSSARDYLAKNDPKAAVIQIKNVLQQDPNLAEARFLLGTALLQGGDAAGSETELRKALELKHSADLVVPPLAQSLLAQRQFKKLTDEFERTNLGQPAAQARLKTSLASAYAAQGKPDLAQVALDAALAADPNYAPAKLEQVRTRMARGDFDGALGIVDVALATAPNSAEAWKLKGDVLYSKSQAADALVAYRKAVEIKPDYLEGHAALLTALIRQGPGSLGEATKQLEALKKVSSGSFATAYFDTYIAFQKKDFKTAKERSQQLMKLAPSLPIALELAGAVELQSNSLLQAESYLLKAVQAAPEAPLPRRLLVNTYLRSGQSAKAVAALLPALKDGKADSNLNALAGEVYLQHGDTKKAEEFFSKAAQQDPKNTRARTSLALTRLSGGREDAGFAELQDIAASDSGVTADLALVNAHLNRGALDKALKAIDALEKKQPNNPGPPNLRGRTLLAKRDLAGARKSFERAVAISPTYFPAVDSLALMDITEKKPDDARKRFESVLEKDPKNAQALLALAELRARTGGTKQEVVDLVNRAITANPTEKAPRLALVEYHLRYKDFKLAESAAQNGVSALPDSSELMDALGRAQQASGDTNQALATYAKAAALQPQSPSPQMRLAEANIAAKNKTAAVQSVRKALDIQPDFLPAQRVLITLLVDAKNYQDAIAVARTVQKQRPKEEIGYVFEGDIATVQKKWDVAADIYRNGLKEAPGSELAVKLHTALFVSGKLADADKLATGWMKDHPKDRVFRMYLADAALSREDFPVAEKMYLNVLQLQPENALALNNLAWVTGKLKKEGAIAYAEKALALAPNQPAYMDTLASLFSDRSDYAKALEWQTKAIGLAPQNSLLKLNLAKIHIKGGKKDLARKELDELAKLGDKFNRHAEVAGLLKTL